MKKKFKKNIKKGFVQSKIGWILIILYFVAIAYFTTQFFGASGFDNKEASSFFSFVSKNSHTGLVAPASQIVFNNLQKPENQFASNVNQESQSPINVSDQIAVSKNVSVALFDIVSTPTYQATKSRIVLIIFSLGAGVLVVMFIISIMRKFKESRIKTET